jgi:hypothetical protein
MGSGKSTLWPSLSQKMVHGTPVGQHTGSVASLEKVGNIHALEGSAPFFESLPVD